MRVFDYARLVGRVLVCIAAVACGQTETSRRDATPTMQIPLDTIESRGELATRREAQPWLDIASDALARKNLEVAATALSDAASFMKMEALTAELDARQALERAATELDTLALRVAHGEVHAPNDLRRVFARTHLAETSLHLIRAHAAMARRENLHAGEQLLMTIDHLERAANDARKQADSMVQAAIADTRSLAIEMTKGMEAVPDEAARVTDEIEQAVYQIDLATTQPAPASKAGAGNLRRR